MPCYDYGQGPFTYCGMVYQGEAVLPADNIILQRTPFTGWGGQDDHWSRFYTACAHLASSITTPRFVFVDASWDPFVMPNLEIVARLHDLEEIFVGSKVCVLSARAQHFYDELPGCLYMPLFAMINYPEIQHRPKQGRIGCLNRRNAPHRVWLMHHLLDQNLVDAHRDVYSVSFVNLWSNSYVDVDSVVGTSWFNSAQLKWPSQIQTHPDNFPNDYSIDHPAWHTGIVIVTETEVDTNTLICEKTAKSILSKSCFSIYMHEVGYCVLTDLGFEPRFFTDHAQHFDIQPIINICRQFDTADCAIDYSHQHSSQIEHNYDWFAYGSGTVQSRPWYARWKPKLQLALDQL